MRRPVIARYRRIRIDGITFRCIPCRTCDQTYLMPAAIDLTMDSGLCASCDSEVAQLESAYCNTAGDLL